MMEFGGAPYLRRTNARCPPSPTFPFSMAPGSRAASKSNSGNLAIMAVSGGLRRGPKANLDNDLAFARSSRRCSEMVPPVTTVPLVAWSAAPCRAPGVAVVPMRRQRRVILGALACAPLPAYLWAR